MKTFWALLKRNIKLFFGDKGMFFSSMITPIILLVLYATFLSGVYEDSLKSSLGDYYNAEGVDSVVTAIVNGQLLSSILAVSCVTVAFCSNLICVQDKYTGVRKDFLASPLKRPILALSYYFGTLAVTLLVAFVAAIVGFVFVAISGGGFLEIGDYLRVFLDTVLLTFFGTALASVASSFMSTQGQSTAVGTVVSAGYGFLCGAYMPIASFPVGLQRFLSFMPGTYGTSLVRSHCIAGALRRLEKLELPYELVDGLKDGLDCNLYFFDNAVGESVKYLILIGATFLLIGAFVLLSVLRKKDV